MMVSTSTVLGGLLLIAAGIFQWTPLKKACLVHCRSPIHFFVQEWKDGKWGTLVRLVAFLLAAQEAYAVTDAFPELVSIYRLLGDPALVLR